MTNYSQLVDITLSLAHKLIAKQFPELAPLPIIPVEKQGHDNRIFRLGDNMLIRMPTQQCYALAVKKEQQFLPLLGKHLAVNIPVPLKMGNPSAEFPFPFSIYKWLEGEPLNMSNLDDQDNAKLALDLAKFLKELQSIDMKDGPPPGQHNWWRGDHVNIYDKNATKQIDKLSESINSNKAIKLWEEACKTKWNKPPVWIHGDFAASNILIKNNNLSSIIDFGCLGIGDPACDLVIAWTFFKGKAREIFIREIDFDEGTWLRARAWALWKATFELCNNANQNSAEAAVHRSIIEDVL